MRVPRSRATPTVRRATPEDADAWWALRDALWPGSPDDHRQEIAEYFDRASDASVCLLAETSGSGPVGFVEAGLRAYAEGCRTSPVGYVEGIFVAEPHRRCGTGRALMTAAEGWARQRGCTEMASDTELHNDRSGIFHAATGYVEVERIICFRKSL